MPEGTFTIPRHQANGIRAALEAFRLGRPMHLQLATDDIVDIHIRGVEWADDGLLLRFVADMPGGRAPATRPQDGKSECAD